MDKDREIRFLYPPLFFFAFLGTAWYFNDQAAAKGILFFLFKETDSAGQAISIITSGGLGILGVGYVLGSITIFFLRIIFFFLEGGPQYEAVLSPPALEAILRRLNTEQRPVECGYCRNEQGFLAGVTFDHAITTERIHLWLRRRWSAFNISANAITGVLVAWLVAACTLEKSLNCYWIGVAVITMVVLFLNAVFAWRDTMHMVEFQAQCWLPRSRPD